MNENELKAKMEDACGGVPERQTDDQPQQLTAEWLKANTRIGGWFAFFVFLTGVGGIASLVSAIVSYNSAAVLMSFAECICATAHVIVAAWVIFSLCQRRPAAIFWAKYLQGIILFSNVCPLISTSGNLTDESVFELVRPCVGSAIWFGYLFFSQRVKDVFPKRYRHAGVCTWLCALTLLAVLVSMVGVAQHDIIHNYGNRVEFSQSELLEGDLTDGHIIFRKPDGWTFGQEKRGDFTIISLLNMDGCGMNLFSTLDPDSSAANFANLVEAARDASLQACVHQPISNGKFTVNGHKGYYLIEQYDCGSKGVLFRHLACLFDQKTSKVAVVSGYFPNKDVPEVMETLKTIRFSR